MSYDIKTLGAILELASERAQNELIKSAFEKRDYEFLNSVIAISGIEPINRAAAASGGLGLGREHYEHPLEIAVIENDPILFDWVVENDLKLAGSWGEGKEEGASPVLNFGALTQAFALKRKHMLPALFALTNEGRVEYDFVFANSSLKFAEPNEFGFHGPAGNTPLTCALVNGWDDVAGDCLVQTRHVYETDLMLAVRSGSAHVDAIASKIGVIDFPDSSRNLLSALDDGQRVRYFDALSRANLPAKIAGSSPATFSTSIRSIEECEFLLDHAGVCGLIEAGGIDPLHNMLGEAVMNKRLDIVKWLVTERGANPNYAGSEPTARRSGRRPPLYMCAGEMLEWLVSAGVDLNEVIPKHGTPLMDAVRNSNVAKVEQLIMLGADTAMKFEGRSALQLAKDDAMREAIRSARVVSAVGGKMGEGSRRGRAPRTASPL